MYRKHEQFKKPEHELETGIDFGRFHTTKRDSQLTFEIEAEREYVNRLKNQREKIQILYDKYDALLQEMQKKDVKISQQLRIIGNLESKVKDFELMTPEIECLRKQNTQLHYERQGLKRELTSIDSDYKDLLTQIRLKTKTNDDHRQEVEDINKQLLSKIRMVQQKFEEKENRFDKEKKSLNNKIQELRKQLSNEKNKHLQEIAALNEEFFKTTQDIEILQNQIRRVNEQVLYERENKANIYLQNQEKMNKVISEHRMRVKSYKQQIQQLKYSNEILSEKIKELNIKIQESNKENINMYSLLTDEKRICQEKVYHIKYHNSQQKTMLREQTLISDSKICKLERQLEESYRREKQLMNCLKSYQDKDKIKKNLRDIEKTELERINRLLLLDK